MSNENSFRAIDLSQLPAPQIIQQLSYEAIFAERKAQLNALQPLLFDQEHQPVLLTAELIETETETFWKVPLNAQAGMYYLDLESEPLTRLLQADVYREMMLRQQLNNAALAMMPAYATGSDLDHLASRDNVTRLQIQAQDTSTIPTSSAIYEADDAFRRRWLLSRESLTAGGSEGWYLFHALSADARVKDAFATSPTPRGVTITILSNEGNGTASVELIASVEQHIKAQFTHVMTDEITVQSAEVIEYSLVADITYYSGASSNLVLEQIKAEFERYKQKTERIGHIVSDSAIKAVLHQEGVYRAVVSTTLPIEVSPLQAAFCTELTLNNTGDDYALV